VVDPRVPEPFSCEHTYSFLANVVAKYPRLRRPNDRRGNPNFSWQREPKRGAGIYPTWDAHAAEGDEKRHTHTI
jgi:hypothetical protein